MKNNKPTDYIIIEGITETGEKFRPSDWAERMCCNLATIRNHRIHYSDLLQPIFKHGIKSVMLDNSLKNDNQALYQSILDFARLNKLRISKPSNQ